MTVGKEREEDRVPWKLRCARPAPCKGELEAILQGDLCRACEMRRSQWGHMQEGSRPNACELWDESRFAGRGGGAYD